jgi:LCP family protein required for cell wall assembly
MADLGGDPYEPFFQAGGPAGSGTSGGTRRGSRTSGGTPPRRPNPHRADRHGAPAPAQQRLMARIEASRKTRQRRAISLASGLVSSLVLFVAGSAWALTGYVSHSGARVNAGTTAAVAGAPLNVLLAGVDRPNGLTPRQETGLHVGRVQGTANSGTMMLVHISPAQHRVTAISLPGDSWVDIPGHGMNKINAAYGLGGPALMVRTVEHATGLTINNYVEVNFLAFVTVIDTLGGVNVCLPQPLHDPSSGISLTAGFHHLDGTTALEYARDRHSFPLEDLSRIQDQQNLMSTALSKIITSGILANPLRLTHLLDSALPALRVNKGLNVVALAGEMRGITPRDITILTVPLADTGYQAPGGESAIVWDAREAGRMFSEIRTDQPVKVVTVAHKAAARHGRKSLASHGHAWTPPAAHNAAQAACR